MDNKYLVSEALAEAFLLQQGYEVARPVDPRRPYDLLMRANKFCSWWAVQVKTAYQEGASKIFNACRTTPTGREHYELLDIDAFIVVDGEDIYKIPIRWTYDKAYRIRVHDIPEEYKWSMNPTGSAATPATS
jgi:hypothetical protein